MTVENHSQWPARPLGTSPVQRGCMNELGVLWTGDDSRNSPNEHGPRAQQHTKHFLSVSNTVRKGADLELDTKPAWLQCLYNWNPSSHPTTVYLNGVPTVALRSSDEYSPSFFFSFSLPTISHCFYAGDIHAVCVLARGPDNLRHPPGLKGKDEEAEKQKQWDHCSGHSSATAHGVLREQCRGLLEPWAAWCCPPAC